MEGTIAVVTPVAYDFTPRYWTSCNGQLLAISTNQALFSLLGTTYGGNGVTTFALPNLQGRVPLGTGTGNNGAPAVTLGEMTGAETAIVTINNMPAHNHNGSITITPRVGAAAEGSTATDNYPGMAANGYANTATPATFTQGPNIVSSTIGIAGSSMPFEILSPYLVLNYVICMQGIFPSRN